MVQLITSSRHGKMVEGGNAPRSPGPCESMPGFVGLRAKNYMSEREIKKEKSTHRQLIEYFSDTAKKTRGFRPQISPKDAKQLKNVLALNILDQTELEKIMLYFLADPSYKNLGPSIATIMSSTVINSLINKLKNRVQFYKELEGYVTRYFSDGRRTLVAGQGVDIAAHLEELRRKLTLSN